MLDEEDVAPALDELTNLTLLIIIAREKLEEHTHSIILRKYVSSVYYGPGSTLRGRQGSTPPPKFYL